MLHFVRAVISTAKRSHLFTYHVILLMTYRALWLVLMTSWLAACSTTTSPTDAELSQEAEQGNGNCSVRVGQAIGCQIGLSQCDALDAASSPAVWSIGSCTATEPMPPG